LRLITNSCGSSKAGILSPLPLPGTLPPLLNPNTFPPPLSVGPDGRLFIVVSKLCTALVKFCRAVVLSLTAAAAWVVVSSVSLAFVPLTDPPKFVPTPFAPPAPLKAPKNPPANSVNALAPLKAANIPSNGNIGLKALANVNNPFDNRRLYPCCISSSLYNVICIKLIVWSRLETYLQKN